ncbi:MAG: non-ribosomal peptide synthetase, partial [Candidatus Aminicenantes bacterium]
TRETETNDKYLCAYLVFHSSNPTDSMDFTPLRQYLSGILPEYMIPSYFVPLEHIPLTSNGKIDRKALPEPELTTSDIYIAPRNKTEETLAQQWAEVLGIEKDAIGIDTNFFELGGHSLRATILAARIRKEFNVEFSLSRVFTGPTIRKFAEFISSAQTSIYEDIEPVEKRDYYSQSSAQKRLFFLDQFEDIGTSYNMVRVLDIRGKMDKERYENAFRTLIARHEALRTSFQLVGSEPVQRIHEQVDFEIEMIHIPAKNKIPGEKQINHLVKEFIRPFDLAKVPLLRVGLMVLSEVESLLLYDMHHIISDGTSMGVLADEFIRLYTGEEPPLLKIQYKDFSIWQNYLFETGQIKQQEEYWLNLYQDKHKIPKLNLPTDYPRPTAIRFEGNNYDFMLESEYTSRLKKLAAENSATLYMSLLAVLNVQLHKLTGQDDIIVGCGIMGRQHTDLENIIGMFVNSLAVRNYPRAEKTYLEFLKEVKLNCVQAFENQDVQLEVLVDKLDLERDSSRNPLFDVLFVVQNYQRREVYMKDLEFAPYGKINETAKFDLALFAFEIGDGIIFTLEYSTRLFKRATIEKMASRFIEILKQVVDDKNIKLKDITMSHQLVAIPSNRAIDDQEDFGF